MHLNAGASEGQKRVSDPLGAGVTCGCEVLGVDAGN